MSKKNIILASVGLIAVIAVVGGYLIWRQYPSCSDGMCTYRNEEYGFEFRYPEAIVFSRGEFPDHYNHSIKRPSFTVGSIGIIIETPENAEYWHKEDVIDNEQATTTTVTLDGITGIKDTYWYVSGWNIAETFPLGEYRISFGTDDKHSQELDALLATFKFLKK